MEVSELFFRTPARRKFLKTEATELAHCIESVRRHALARPDVGFAIWHEGKLVEQWRAPLARRRQPASARPSRLSRRAGRGPSSHQSVAVSTAWGPITVTGRAGLPDAARSRPDHQYCYVNGRFVRDKVLTHAARAAYEDVLHGHEQPIYVLYVEIDPARVDVNVHPTKIEVRFRDSREVHQAVRHAVENALALSRAGQVKPDASHVAPVGADASTVSPASLGGTPNAGTSGDAAAPAVAWPTPTHQQNSLPWTRAQDSAPDALGRLAHRRRSAVRPRRAPASTRSPT